MEVHGFSIREEEIVYSPWKHGVVKTDLSTEKRQLVIDYVQQKYGEVFNVRTVSDLQDKGAVVKAAKFLGMTHSEATKLSKNINSVDDLEEGEVKEYAKHFVGRLNAYGKHASAVAVFPKDHTQWCSVEKQGDDKVAAQDFHIMEQQGLLKLDLLGLTTLDIIEQCIKHINGNFDINKIDYADPLTAKLLQAGNTDGLFQVESQTMTGLIQGIKAKDVRDLSAVVALGRPAILDMELDKTFIKRRNGEEVVEYKDPKLQPILKETEGLMLYQEQVMKVVQVMCGYSLGEADNVRRVIGRKVKEDVAEIKADIIKKGVALGNPEDVMKALGDEVEAFASYGFNKCFSGDTILDRNYRSQNRPLTIAEMYKTMNDRKWAIKYGHKDLYKKYRSYGYGNTLSMFDNRIKANRIVNIYHNGTRPVWKITLHNGATVKATSNHSFITRDGKKLLCELTTDDFLPVKGDRYKPKHNYNFGTSGSHNHKKGHRGFVKTGGPSVDFKNFKARHKGQPCELCGEYDKKMETHHINMDRTNNSDENLMWLCTSCHKKEHYKMGRTKRGENGYNVDYVQIIDISFMGFEDTYDVEMAAPAHNLVTSTGIVACNSHSVAYAMTAWRTAYLKAHYPCEFMAAVLDANREDKEKFSYYISSCEKMGIEIRQPRVDSSSAICTPIPKENAIQLGFSCIAGVKNKKVDTHITDAKSYLEEHSTYNKTVLTGLVKSGALDKFSDCSRSELLEYVDWVKDKRKSRPDFTFSGNEVESDGLMEFSVLGYAFTDVFSQFNLDWLPFGAVAAIITSVKAHKTRKGKPMAFVKADIRGKGVQELVIFDDTFKKLEKGKCYALKLRDTIINDFTELKKK